MTKINMKQPGADILAGVVVGLVSIPISMGYAQIAGLPAVYGLYGSLLPILAFALLTSSPQFVVGVDAMPAVMVGSALGTMGLTLGSEEALGLVPVISLLVGVWFLVFWALRLGRVVKYISGPVMGGFISGVGATIILMQLPKLFGGDPGTGELPALLLHLVGELPKFHPLSACLGLGTVLIIQFGRKAAPKIPLSVILLLLSVLLAALLPLESMGVKLLPATEAGLPRLIVPKLSLLGGRLGACVTCSLTVALVVMAQTLLASNNYERKYRDTLDTRRELIAYAAAEFCAAAVGCCPVNGSVSRAGLADQYGCRSQLMSIVASAVMLLVLLFGTPLLRLMPVPVLTGIVISALIGILEIPMAKKLYAANKQEFTIFLAAFFGVLLLGTMGGVIVGVLLSFFAVVVRAVVPPRAFLGVIEGHEGYYDLTRNPAARPIRQTVLYRFSGNLFFANIDTFRDDIESAIRPDTRQVIVDGRGIGNIDITAAERVLLLEESLRARGIRLYLTGHVGAVNDQLRQYGAVELMRRGSVRRTVNGALRDAGVTEPFPLEDREGNRDTAPAAPRQERAELEWLFGDETEAELERIAAAVSAELTKHFESEQELFDAERHIGFAWLSLADEEALLDRIESQLDALLQDGKLTKERLRAYEERIERLRARLEALQEQESSWVLPLIRARREALRETLRRRDPERIARLEALWRERHQ